MKKQFFTSIALLTAVLVLTAVSVSAQATPAMKTDIPFEFVVDDEIYPAGEYVVERINPQNPWLMIMKNAEGKAKKIFMTNRVRSEAMVEKPKFVFSKYADAYYLSELWTGSTKNGLGLLKSKGEREIELTLKDERETVVLLASLF